MNIQLNAEVQQVLLMQFIPENVSESCASGRDLAADCLMLICSSEREGLQTVTTSTGQLPIATVFPIKYIARHNMPPSVMLMGVHAEPPKHSSHLF